MLFHPHIISNNIHIDIYWKSSFVQDINIQGSQVIPLNSFYFVIFWSFIHTVNFH